jgi:DNA (cytosine-5)-methyltransferase 1
LTAPDPDFRRSSTPAVNPAGVGARETMHLVLSLFPGIDLLGRAFHAAGFAVVKGPDVLWDEQIENFHVPPGRFDGIIGGPPCTEYSDANRRRRTEEGDRLVREFLRVVDESRPTWFLMENVRNVPDVQLSQYQVQRVDVIDTDFGGRQRRLRHIQFGHVEGWIIRPLRTPPAWSVTPVATLTTAPAGPGDRHGRRCAKQGFPTLPLRTLTPAARRRVIGNGVPFNTGLAVARAVTAAGPVTPWDCHCGCGRQVNPPQRLATDACRQRSSRRRRGHARAITLEAAADRTVTAARSHLTTDDTEK